MKTKLINFFKKYFGAKITIRDEFLSSTYNKSKRKLQVCNTSQLHGNGIVKNKMIRYEISYDEYLVEYNSLFLEGYLIEDKKRLYITEKGRNLVHRGGFFPNKATKSINAINDNAPIIISLISTMVSIFALILSLQ